MHFEPILLFNIPTKCKYMTLQSLHSDMFWHDNGNFKEYRPSPKLFIIKWIASMEFTSFMKSAVNVSFYMDTKCEFSIALWMYMSYCKTFKYKIFEIYKI
jgi:hypothetical protein